MSNDSAEPNAPWHRAYRRETWNGPRPPWPPGRNPQVDLFDEKLVKKLITPSAKKCVFDWKALQQDLRDLSEDYLTAIITTPFVLEGSPSSMTLSKRAIWVQRHLYNPATELLDALSPVNAPLRSDWPDLATVNEPNIETLRTNLEKLKLFARDLYNSLNEQIECKINPTQEFYSELIGALEGVFRTHFPSDEVRTGTSDQGGKLTSLFAYFSALCSKEILGKDAAMTNYRIRSLTSRKRTNVDDSAG